MFVFTSLYEIRLAGAVDDKEKAAFPTKAWASVKGVLQCHDFASTEPSSCTAPFPLIRLCIHNESNSSMLVNVLQNLVTIDFNENSTKKDVSKHRQLAEKMQSELQLALPDCIVNRVTPIKRGTDMWLYNEFGDGRVVEDDYSATVFEKRSEYQKVTINYSEEFGNTLLLDGIENISERHDTYTPMLLGIKDGIDYKDKEVLILGGGDGAALNQLRKLSPKMVTMVEIDEVVLRACREHLRGCCGDSLDRYSGENYEIIVGDCVEYLENCIKTGREFDYVISDITDIPIEAKLEDKSLEEQKKQVFFADVGSDGWVFLRKVFNLCLKVLPKDGLIMTHVTAGSNKSGIEKFVAQVKSLDEELDVKLAKEFVAPFLESWMFCQLRRRLS